MTFESFLELAEKRYSVRSYSNKEIEKDKLDKILKTGQLAPTAGNFQPQRIFVLQSKKVYIQKPTYSFVLVDNNFHHHIQ